MTSTRRYWFGSLLTSRAAAIVAAFCLLGAWLPANAANPVNDFVRKAGSPGEVVYKAHCAACHDKGLGHAPPETILMMMSAKSIHTALAQGAMRMQGSSLSDAEKVQVAEFISGKPLGAASEHSQPPQCTKLDAEFDFNAPPGFPGWGLTPGNTRTIPRDVSGLDSSNVSRLRLKWAFGFPDAIRARSAPAIAGGALYVGSQSGTVYALDLKSGCVRWQFEAGTEVRTGIVVSPWRAGDGSAVPLVYFGDLIGNIFALDARTGHLVWRDHADEHPSTTITAAPTLYKGRLYVSVSSLEEAIIDPTYECCVFRGSVIAYDAGTGTRIWQTFLVPKPEFLGLNAAGAKRFGPAGAAVWNTPAIDVKRNQLTVGTSNDYSIPSAGSDSIVALDLATGKVKWRYQALAHDSWNTSCQVPPHTLCPTEEGPDYDFGAATILATASNGRDFVLGGAKSGDVFAIDPDTGRLIWKTKVGRGGILAGVYFGMATSGDRVFVPISDLADGRKYKEPAKPGLYALDLKTGKFLWKAPMSAKSCEGRPNCSPGITSAITATSDLVLTGAVDGWLRLYDAATGKILWKFDTAQSFKTVGGEKASGGSIGGGASPIAYHGMLIVPSGYGFATQRPGNILLMFDTNGKSADFQNSGGNHPFEPIHH